jgi:hypothetical protein
MVKRIIGTLCGGNENDWELYLPATQYFINQSIHSSHGCTPFAAMFARSANNFQDYFSLDPGRMQTTIGIKDFVQDVEQFIRPMINDFNSSYQDKVKKQYDSKSKVTTKELSPGQIVYLEITPDLRTGLSPSFEGPYLISRRNRAGNYVLQTEKGYRIPKRTYPLSKLKVIDLPLKSLPSLPKSHATILKVVGHEGESTETKYWVQWKGKTIEEKTLLPIEDIVNYRLIQTYWNRYYKNLHTMRGDNGDSSPNT